MLAAPGRGNFPGDLLLGKFRRKAAIDEALNLFVVEDQLVIHAAVGREDHRAAARSPAVSQHASGRLRAHLVSQKAPFDLRQLWRVRDLRNRVPGVDKNQLLLHLGRGLPHMKADGCKEHQHQQDQQSGRTEGRRCPAGIAGRGKAFPAFSGDGRRGSGVCFRIRHRLHSRNHGQRRCCRCR